MTGLTRHVVIAIDIGDGRPWWIAHEFPERPVDDYCVWSWDCTPCMLHLIAAARGPDAGREAQTFGEHTIDGTATSVGEVLAEALAWRAERGFPDIFTERTS